MKKQYFLPPFFLGTFASCLLQKMQKKFQVFFKCFYFYYFFCVFAAKIAQLTIFLSICKNKIKSQFYFKFFTFFKIVTIFFFQHFQSRFEVVSLHILCLNNVDIIFSKINKTLNGDLDMAPRITKCRKRGR